MVWVKGGLHKFPGVRMPLLRSALLAGYREAAGGHALFFFFLKKKKIPGRPGGVVWVDWAEGHS